MRKEIKKSAIYQAKNGAIEFRGDFDDESMVWGSLNQIAELFSRDKSVISRHIKNIFKSGELDKNSVVVKIATTAADGKTYQVDYYNLDVILSVGYRVDSKTAIDFRKWATKILKQHITQGFSINPNALERNKKNFLKTLEDLKLLASESHKIAVKDVLGLIQAFSNTWFSLEKFDKNDFPKEGTQTEVSANAQELYDDLQKLKQELIKKGEASELFAQEKQKDTLTGIFGSIFQSVFGQDAYPCLEEKAAHLLYFIIKNHPFNDGNKRSGAFAFIWLLYKANYDFSYKISPETLTSLTLFIAESKPADKEKMIGVILLLLNTTD